MTTEMDNKEMAKRIDSVTLCLMSHPDNEPDSEFADRIDDLIQVRDALVENLSVLADVSGCYSLDDLKTSFNEGQAKNLTGQDDGGDHYEDVWFQFEDWFEQWSNNR